MATRYRLEKVEMIISRLYDMTTAPKQVLFLPALQSYNRAMVILYVLIAMVVETGKWLYPIAMAAPLALQFLALIIHIQILPTSVQKYRSQQYDPINFSFTLKLTSLRLMLPMHLLVTIITAK